MSCNFRNSAQQQVHLETLELSKNSTKATHKAICKCLQQHRVAGVFLPCRIEVDEVQPSGFATKPAKVPFLPFLVGVVVAMLGVTVLVAQRTS